MTGYPKYPVVFLQRKLIHNSCSRKVYEQMKEARQRPVTQQCGEGLQRVPSVLWWGIWGS